MGGFSQDVANEMLESAIKENERIKAEMEVLQGFYNLAIKERDAERIANDRLRADIERLQLPHEKADNMIFDIFKKVNI